jgi:pyruvate dehydrogenase E1 component alpha subunit
MTSDVAPCDLREATGWLEQMLFVRRFEEKCAELYGLGKIRGFLHLYIGEEAVAVGAIPLLTAEDAIVSTYREHGHALIRGISPEAVMAEMFGKTNGCSRGRGGSMHLFDASRRFYGGNAIVAGGLPLAVGMALADKLQRRSRVTMCLFGDGAVAEGEFHESLNLAALWKLPVIFLCENNLYAMGTHIDRHQSTVDLTAKAASYGMPAVRVDGMDLLAMRAAAQQAIAQVRAGSGPCFLEAQTYRFRAHSMYDAELYRSKDEVAKWKERDPIDGFLRHLRLQPGWRDETVAALEAGIVHKIEAAIAAADAGSWEPGEQLERDVYANSQGTPLAAVPNAEAA